MKVLVFSDSHGKINGMLDILNRSNDINMVIHLGDLVKDVEDVQYQFPEIEFICVAGNNDWFSDEPAEKLLEICGKKVFITHGNQYGVKMGYTRLLERGRQIGAEMVLFGHTHIPYENYLDGVLLINPGSISLPAARSRQSYCVISITDQDIKTKIHSLEL